MSDASANNLSKEKVQQLLLAIGSRPTEDTTTTEAAEYNWHQPHCFTREQLNELDDLTRKTCKKIAQKFAALCHGDFNVTVASTTQHFADEITEQALDSKRNDYYLAFGTDRNRLCGFISIPLQTAFLWASQLLGGAQAEEDSRSELSLLEESLLLDVASAIVEAISESDSSCNFQPAENAIKRRLPLELEGTEELCKITFNVKKTYSETDSEAHFLILCDDLEPILGKITQAVDEFSPENISKAILGNLQEMLLSVTAQLASTTLTFEELMDLKADDILLLDKTTDEPVELIVEGRAVLYGRPAKSAGKYAVLITEISQYDAK